MNTFNYSGSHRELPGKLCCLGLYFDIADSFHIVQSMESGSLRVRVPNSPIKSGMEFTSILELFHLFSQ